MSEVALIRGLSYLLKARNTGRTGMRYEADGRRPDLLAIALGVLGLPRDAADRP